MAELSIEEKAKAYDEALERAKNTIEVNQTIPNIVECVESLFPILKESKDEKIRKDIIGYLQYSMAFDKSFLDKKYNWSQKDCSKWIAWLKKQDEKDEEILILKDQIESLHAAIKAVKETHKIELEKQEVQKLDGTFINVDDVREDFVNEVYRVLDADSTNDRANQIIYAFDNLPIVTIEKQDEQKPETIFLKFKIGDKVTNGEDTYTINFIGKDCYWVKEHDCATIPFEYQHNWKLVEQNHTDKVEPKFKIGQTIKKEGFNLGFTIVKIEDGLYFNYMGDHFPFTDQDNWELVEQKSVWSEEDEQVFNVLKSELEKYIMLKQYSTPLCINDIWWFKALKNRVQPQNTWKPSDEQITWLYRAADDAKEHSRMKQILNELLSNLKKLREEYDKLDLNK